MIFLILLDSFWIFWKFLEPFWIFWIFRRPSQLRWGASNSLILGEEEEGEEEKLAFWAYCEQVEHKSTVIIYLLESIGIFLETFEMFLILFLIFFGMFLNFFGFFRYFWNLLDFLQSFGFFLIFCNLSNSLELRAHARAHEWAHARAQEILGRCSNLKLSESICSSLGS